MADLSLRDAIINVLEAATESLYKAEYGASLDSAAFDTTQTTH